MTRATTPASLPALNYTARDFRTIQNQLIRFVRATRNEEINSFAEGDVAKILIELMSFVGDMLSYSIDRAGEEAFIATARTYSAMLRHAAGIAYPVAAASGASVDLVPTAFVDIPEEVTTAASANEKKIITIGGTPTGGTFTLVFEGESSIPIAYNATSAVVQTALEAMSSIRTGNVRVTGAVGGPWTVEFINDLAFRSIPAMTIVATNVTKNEKQRIAATGTPTGTFRITFNGQQTLPISVAASGTGSGSIEEALVNLSNIAPGQVSVTGGPGGPWVVEFKNGLGNTNHSPMTLDTGSVSGGTLAVTTLEDGGAITSAVTVAQQGVNNTYDVTFTKGTQFTSAGLTWEVARDTTILGIEVTADNYEEKFKIPVVQGSSFIETFTGTGRRFQEMTTSNESVIDNSLEVRVGSPLGTLWTRVDTLATAQGDETVYTLRYTESGQAVIRFGDSITGKIINESEAVYVTGRSGGGVSGNVGPAAISSSITGSATKTTFPPLTVAVPFVNKVASSGGRDRESLEEIRRTIPAWIRTVDKALTKEDYDTLGGAYESDAGSIARCASYLSSATLLYQKDGEVITQSNPLLVPKGTQITIGNRSFETAKDFTVTEPDPLLFFNPNVVYVYVWSPGDRGFVPSSSTLQSQVRSYLQERSVVTTTIFVLPGRQRVINIDLGEVTYFASFNKSVVEQAIIDATKSFFLSDDVQPGESFRLSDYYQVIERIPGVKHFVIQTPTEDVSVVRDEIPYMGTLSYTMKVAELSLDQDGNKAAFGDELYS